MKELCDMELFEVDGGKKYKCTYCGYTSSSTSKMALHFGIKTWHYLLGGRIKEYKKCVILLFFYSYVTFSRT